MRKVTAKANINIALCKYWGKSDVDKVYPTTTSISFTLDTFYTITTITSQSHQKANTIIINDHFASNEDVVKVNKFLDRFSNGEKVMISSKNYVPTKAGLASSASAYASIAMAAKEFFNLDYSLNQLAQITRFGSGSASRSIFDGFVKWEANSDIIEKINAPMMDVGMFVIMIDDSQKKVSSTKAMELSKNTSWMYDAWVNRANIQAKDMEDAIINQDFHRIGALAQDNAMSMHMTMLTTNPSIVYFQPKTIEIMHHLLDLQAKKVPLYFTMDAGPNIKVFILNEDKKDIERELLKIVPKTQLIYSLPGKGATLLYE